MRPFAYARPRTLDEALSLLDRHGPEARVLAGGTDVIVRLRMGHMKPVVVVDVKGVTDLSSDIVERDGHLRIGAGAVMTDLIGHAQVRKLFPALVDAAGVVGSVQIRNRATLAGNICNASPAADTAPVLLVYGAIVNLVGTSGRTRVPLTDFFTGPGKTVLGRGELVESIDLPLPSRKTGAAFGRVTRRYGVDLATINLGCAVDDSGEVRVAYGAVGPRPFLVHDETGILANPAASASATADAVARLVSHATPITDVRGSREYRLGMLTVMTRRTLDAARRRLGNGA